MEFGIFSNGSRPLRPESEAWDEDLYEIVLGDRLGFSEAWISEHAVAGELLLCKAAALTKRIKLGPGVRSLPLYHPVHVAVEANACDHLTHGRYLMGCGVGFFPRRMMERNIDPGEGHARMHEALDLILKCWTETEPFDWDGRYYQGKEIVVRPRQVQQPYPPIAVACTESCETAEMAGRRGFGLLFGSTDSAEHTHEMAEHYVAAGGSRSNIRTCRFVYVTDSVDKARRELRESMSIAIEQEQQRNPHRFKRRLPPSGRMEDITFDYMVDEGHLIVGDPDTVHDQLVRFYEETGGFGTLMFHMGRDYGTRRGRARSMRLFMSEVAPTLRALTPA